MLILEKRRPKRTWSQGNEQGVLLTNLMGRTKITKERNIWKTDSCSLRSLTEILSILKVVQVISVERESLVVRGIQSESGCLFREDHQTRDIGKNHYCSHPISHYFFPGYCYYLLISLPTLALAFQEKFSRGT